ncbi:unnamed protein product [Amoebophrya sp. A25]|nr:unnamed protein product [Amoebophrya sp. A25]|eukprot:GSA25T00004958001.1
MTSFSHLQLLAFILLNYFGLVSALRREMLRTKLFMAHHDTAAEACQACQTNESGATCYSGKCGDGSGKFCWSTSTQTGFTLCSTSSR